MIASIIVGSGSNRTSIGLVRDKRQLRSLGGALKGALFPSKEAHAAAMSVGRQRAAQYKAATS